MQKGPKRMTQEVFDSKYSVDLQIKLDKVIFAYNGQDTEEAKKMESLLTQSEKGLYRQYRNDAILLSESLQDNISELKLDQDQDNAKKKKRCTIS